MTDAEAIEKAQKELSIASYNAETSMYAGIRSINQNKEAWLVRVLRLARKALWYQEEQEIRKQQANKDRIILEPYYAEKVKLDEDSINSICNSMSAWEGPLRKDGYERVAFYMLRAQGTITRLFEENQKLKHQQASRKKPTMGDKIRSMSDDELTDAIYKLIYATEDHALWFCKGKKECGDLMDADKEIPEEMCRKCLLEKLRQPVEDPAPSTMNEYEKQHSGLLEED